MHSMMATVNNTGHLKLAKRQMALPFLKKFFYVFILKERERGREGGREGGRDRQHEWGTGKEKERESQAASTLSAQSPMGRLRPTNFEIMTWTEVSHLTY